MNRFLKTAISLLAALAFCVMPACDKNGVDSSTSQSASSSAPPEVIEPVYNVELNATHREYGSSDVSLSVATENAYNAVYEIKATSSTSEALGSAVALFTGTVETIDELGEQTVESYTYLATCLSLIEGADEYIVRSSSGISYDAEFIGADPNTDIAVVSVHDIIPVAEIVDDSEKIPLNDEMFVVGIPFNAGAGVLKNTYLGAKEHNVTIGSQVRRLMTISDELNQGYKGGAAYVKNGGVFAGMIAEMGDLDTFGYTFVIPSNIVLDISMALASTHTSTNYGYVEGNFFLGAVFEDSKMSSSQYVYISQIDQTGSLYEGGLRELDKITRIAYIPEGKTAEHSFIEVASSSQVEDFIEGIEDLKIGDVLYFKCIRGGLALTRSIEITQYIYKVEPPEDDE